MRNLNEIAADIAFTSTSKGFESPNVVNINQKLLLVVSEVCEAQEELRDGKGFTEVYYEDAWTKDMLPVNKPCGFPSEIADAIIRLLHIAHCTGININDVIEEKIAFNKTRPEKHGRKF